MIIPPSSCQGQRSGEIASSHSKGIHGKVAKFSGSLSFNATQVDERLEKKKINTGEQEVGRFTYQATSSYKQFTALMDDSSKTCNNVIDIFGCNGSTELMEAPSSYLTICYN
ncbi:unnamed protein product [Lepeophtheirus salmonis]|uniref:(salmon louse) hypothetical protein n=1 Tax=Lepeophtheirus salmonis TaxID=72036 RepID=A0A7R8H7W9_LEPSM|nr:unnamed protein product [Lepeophtheirus salmonis]CAF2911746.1 unnamed protein product [Lepeophtheirus salmonis]